MTPRNKFTVPFKLGQWVPTKQSQPSEGVSGSSEPPRSQLDWNPRSGPTAGPRGSGYEVGRDRHYPHLPKTSHLQLLFFCFQASVVRDFTVDVVRIAPGTRPRAACEHTWAGMDHADRTMSQKHARQANGPRRVGGGLTRTVTTDGQLRPIRTAYARVFPCVMLYRGPAVAPAIQPYTRCHIYIAYHLAAS